MKNRFDHIFKSSISLAIIAVLFMAFVAVPSETYAASKKKTVLTVSNLSSDTVVQKGGTYQVNASAYRKKGNTVKGLKVRYKSSNKKIATVSKNGVIRGKKNGKVKITVRCNGKKKTYKIRVGTPVNSLYITGYHYLRRGRTNTLKAHVNGNATNKTVHWRSSNTSVATISSSGKLTAKDYGTATVTAYAADGSGTAATVTVAVPKYYGYPGGGIKWIAHRGLHTSATENTAAAFRAAGQAGGFWGCECDIWETKHEIVTTAADLYTQEIDEEEREVPEEIKEETIQPDDLENDLENQDLVTPGEQSSPVQTSEVQTTATRETFDIVINHDDTFKRTFGVNRAVKDMTATEIKNQLPAACFFDEYLQICKTYNMVPVVEFKDPGMSDVAIQKAVDMLYDNGQLESAYLISFHTGVLERVNIYAKVKLGHAPYTAYLVSNEDFGAVDHAKAKGYTCISINHSGLSPALYRACVEKGLKVGTWTYHENANDDHLLYLHTLSGQYKLEFATVDYKPY